MLTNEGAAMSEQTPVTLDLIARMNAGDRAARDELFRHVAGRLEGLARKMLKKFPGVARWCQSGDVLQGAQVRLLRALEECRPAGPREFFALTSQQLRRELIDLLRHFHGPQGAAAHHASQVGQPEDAAPAHDRADQTHDPAELAGWTALHQQIESLPADEREVVELLFYQDCSQEEAARLMGVSVRTVQRRWQSAVLKLHHSLGGWPGL
jgi:RNA polymerase sigma-70 factor (ECF subfamily)